jgi:two-component system LytT family sensor kinase
MRPVPNRYLVALALCSLLGLLNATETWFWGQISGHPFAFVLAIASAAPVWLLWSLVAPTCARWGQRFRLEWPPRRAVVAAHLAGVAFTATFFDLVNTCAHQIVKLGMMRDPFWIDLRNGWVYALPMATIIYAATIGIGYAAEHGRRARELEQIKTQLAQAQLSALRMQLNPHFLFNALHTIAVFVREHDETQAVELIERLGDVLRHVLRTTSAFEAPLASEIAFVQKYVEIEQARFGDRLSVSYGLEGDLGTALVPQLIVQPLVENALKHGLAPRAAAGHLAIAARRQGEILELSVADDGIGLASGWDASHGVGLANMRARLQRMYGDAARLLLEARPEGGVRATVTLPFHTEGARA